MESQTESPVEPITIKGLWDFEYNYFAGETASRFFARLRDGGVVSGTRCPSCKRVLVPARSFCDACFVATTDWVDVGPEGTLEIFSIVGTQFPGLPPPPYIMAYVTLDGADTAVLNHVTGIPCDNLDEAAEQLMKRPRVRTCFKTEREGRITDFSFEIIT